MSDTVPSVTVQLVHIILLEKQHKARTHVVKRSSCSRAVAWNCDFSRLVTTRYSWTQTQPLDSTARWNSGRSSSPGTNTVRKQLKVECTHRVRTHAVLLLSASPHSECEWSAIVVWNEVSLCSIIDPVTLTFQSQSHVTSSISQDHSLHQVWTLWDHSFIVFELRYGQTDKSLKSPT